MWYNENGSIVEQISFDSNNRSFKYGDGIFETIRFFNGKSLQRQVPIEEYDVQKMISEWLFFKK